MGGIKMPLKRLQGAGSLRMLSWSPMTEQEETTADKKELEFRVSKPSCHQTPCEILPLPPSVWRKSPLQHGFNQPSIVEQPGLTSRRQRSAYEIMAQRKKSMMEKKKPDFLLSKLLKSIHSLYPAKIKWKDTDPEIKMLQQERIKELMESLASSVEEEQIYAAQALGCLRITDEFVLSALRNTLQVSKSQPVRYEVTRTLVLFGCLDAAVVKELIRHLKKGSPTQRKDLLTALTVTLHAWAAGPESKVTAPAETGPKGSGSAFSRCQYRPPQYEMKHNQHHCSSFLSQRSVVGAQARLVGTLEQLAASQDRTDDSVLLAATCLVYLDASNPAALEALLRCLTQENMKKKMQALLMLVKHVNVVSADIIQALIDQLRHSPVYKHRADAANLLSTVGLEPIRWEGLEEEVFQLLVEKLHQEPFLVVRQTVAMTAAALQMKRRIWDIVEKQLKERSEVSRRQAVVSLGVLGLRNKNVFFTLLEMLEVDSSLAVRMQVIRTFCTLGMNNTHVLKTLMLKEQTDGALARECAKALKILQKLPGARRGLEHQISQLS
ncbi:protein HEATR9 [Mauremys mutica]|uniref:protein HEATR9 n=1 Tax=Mauremys mutica TaxID=74926 RepID=UPI001D16C00B|nr:protein HEATR9 [Mauremys mutica]